MMDQAKIGKFISDMRKKQGLTQKQLAEQLNVTDKTVSKWETGYRLPDASLLLELSSLLKADINELLAGEEFLQKELPPEEYAKKSGIALSGLALLILFAASLRTGSMVDMIDLPTLFYLLGLKLAVMSISGWFHDYMNAWKMCLPGKRLSKEEMELAVQAVRYASALTLTLGCLIALLGTFSLLNYMDDLSLVWSSFAQIILALLYTAIIKTVYVILAFRIKRMLRNA